MIDTKKVARFAVLGKCYKFARKWAGAVLCLSAVLYVAGTQTGVHALNVAALVPLAWSVCVIVRHTEIF